MHALFYCSTASGGLDRVSEFELNAALQDALAAGTAGTAGTAGRAPRASAHILPPPPEAQQVPQAIPQRVHALARLRLRLEPGWPLSLLVGEEMLAQYNRVLVLLLQASLRPGGTSSSAKSLAIARARTPPHSTRPPAHTHTHTHSPHPPHPNPPALLMQLRWVKQSLQSVRYQGWKAGRRASLNPMARDGLQHQVRWRQHCCRASLNAWRVPSAFDV